jgi:hypothetical protein
LDDAVTYLLGVHEPMWPNTRNTLVGIGIATAIELGAWRSSGWPPIGPDPRGAQSWPPWRPPSR